MDISEEEIEYIKKLERKKRKMRDLLFTKEYIEWFEKFVSRYQDFEVQDIKDVLDDEEDIKNAKNLGWFYENIETYMKENYISPELDERIGTRFIYYIKYNDITYELIGFNPSNPFGHLHIRISQEVSSKVIDFNDIMLGIEQPNTERIRKNLQEETKRLKEIFKARNNELIDYTDKEKSKKNTLKKERSRRG